jgi:hypothetical protein
MKTLNLYFVIILINLFTLRATAQSKKHKFKAIQISANILCDNVPASDYSIILFEDGVKLDSIFNGAPESVDAIFQLNQTYTMQIMKEGFEDVIIMVNTNLPDGISQLYGKTQKLNIIMSKLLYKKENKEEQLDQFVIDKTLGMLVRKSSQFEAQPTEITSGVGNLLQNGN